MPTLTTATIAQSGGDYTSLTTWESTEQKNLVSADEQHTGIISGSWDNPYNWWTGSYALDINGWTTDTTRYVHLIATSGSETKMPPTNTQFRIIETGEPDWPAIKNSDDYTVIENIYAEITWTGTGGADQLLDDIAAFEGVWKNCISVNIVNVSSNGGTRKRCYRNADSTGTKYINCVAIQKNIGAGKIRDIYGYQLGGFDPTRRTVAYNCISYLDGGYDSNNTISYTGADEIILKNCISVITDDPGNAGGLGGTFHTSSRYFISNLDEFQSYVDQFSGSTVKEFETPLFMDAANNDLHLQWGDTVARGYAIDITSDDMGEYSFNTDIDGDTRSTPWDAGPDQATPPPPEYIFRAPEAVMPEFKYV